jgi:O-antigen/teichoic acid export membrane protein
LKKARRNFVKIIKSEFAKNVLILTSGTAFAQLIPLLIAPILSRIYSPEEFGRLAIFIGVVEILAVISTGRYEFAILQTEKYKSAIKLTVLSICIASFVAIISLVLIFFFGGFLSKTLGDIALEYWLYLVPIAVLFIGMYNSLLYYNVREKGYKDISKANIIKSIAGGGTKLLMGIIGQTAGGLLIGQTASNFFGNWQLFKKFLKNKKILKETKLLELKSLAKRYIDFPKYAMSGILFNTASIQLPNFFISKYYSLSNAGHYSYAYRYLGLPLSLIGNSIGQVYLQKLSDTKNDNRKSLSLYYSTIKNLFFVGGLIFIPLFFIVEELYSFVFGEHWRIAGKYSKLMLPLLYIRFVTVPISATYSIFERQKTFFLWQLGLFILTMSIYGMTYLHKWEIYILIKIQTIALSFYYLLLIVISRSMILSNKINN